MVENGTSTVLLGPDIASAGPLTRKVLEYARLMQQLVPVAQTPQDWAPLAELVAVDEFRRVGTFLEVQNWRQYIAMLSQWAAATTKFETAPRRIAELPGFVYFEIEERHVRGDRIDVVNSMTVFAFNEAGKIRGLDVYLQRPR